MRVAQSENMVVVEGNNEWFQFDFEIKNQFNPSKKSYYDKMNDEIEENVLKNNSYVAFWKMLQFENEF
jgi:hypothetical protein